MTNIQREILEKEVKHEVRNLHTAHVRDCNPGISFRSCIPNCGGSTNPHICSQCRLLYYLGMHAEARNRGQSGNGTHVQEDWTTQSFRCNGYDMDNLHLVPMATPDRRYPDCDSMCVLVSPTEQHDGTSEAQESDTGFLIPS